MPKRETSAPDPPSEVYGALIVGPQHPYFWILFGLYEVQKGACVTWGSRLFYLQWDTTTYPPAEVGGKNGAFFTELDVNEKERRDPSGNWGKFRYMGPINDATDS